MFKYVGKLLGMSAMDQKQREEEFFTAVIAGDLEYIGKLVKEGMDPNCINSESYNTALHIVAEKGDLKTGRYLLGLKNIDINKHANVRHGDPPILTAIIFNRSQFTSMLLHFGANPNIQNIFGRTPLHAAIRKKNVIMVKALLVSKAQPNVTDTFGNTPLSFSIIEYPSQVIAEMLLRRGADPNFRTVKAEPLLLELAMNCRSNKHLLMVKLMVQHKADVNIKNLISEQTALHIVSITGFVPLARVLIKCGANPNLKDLTGRTPYKMAIEHRHSNLIAFYKEREKVIEDFMKGIALEERRRSAHSVPSIISKKKMSVSTPRSVRFSEVQSKESDVELFLQHLD